MMLTLTSDFGLEDVYVGVMKGVIASICPDLNVVDLTHQIPPQNIAAGRFCLMNAVPYFPKKTVHVAVVDPGVGSDRKGCAIALENSYLVGPDNGLFSGVLSQFPAQKAVALTNSQYWRVETVSHTFHGRDIFAPVGAHLANGIPLEAFGETIPLHQLTDDSLPSPDITSNQILGSIQYIDYFGNLITNIPATAVQGKQWLLQINQHKIPSAKTYSSYPPQSLITLVGSHGWVEIAMNQGNAAATLGLNYGSAIALTIEKPN
ncbi:MAG: SAM-dependent chlorinase/fluorinase [Halothece sp. Uz-M2-17]|nr:SAM-dependent chlorinase/fluorinase [Halothece sp. Uz-M2-17]